MSIIIIRKKERKKKKGKKKKMMRNKEIVIREFDGSKDCIGVEDVERRCEVGPSGKLCLFTDLLGDPICRVRNSPAFLMLVYCPFSPFRNAPLFFFFFYFFFFLFVSSFYYTYILSFICFAFCLFLFLISYNLNKKQ